MNEEGASQASLLAEYGSAYSGVLHYDSFRWSSGSMLIAGVFLFWGVVFTNNSTEELFGPASVVVALIMTIWILYASHYRQLYLLKLLRIVEIETALDMKANRRFQKDGPYKAFGAKGHNLDLVLYVLVSCSGSLFGFVRQGFEPWQVVPLLVAASAVPVVVMQEKRSKAHRDALSCNA